MVADQGATLQECNQFNDDFCTSNKHVMSIHAFELAKKGRCTEHCQEPAEKDCLSNMERSTRSLEGNQGATSGGGSQSTANSQVIAFALFGSLAAIALVASLALFVVRRYVPLCCRFSLYLAQALCNIDCM
jgi:hypothetical protein